MDQAILEREAMRLSPKDRALLADALLESLDDEAAKAVEGAWAEVAAARLAAYRRGEISAVDGPSAIQQLRTQFRR